MGDLIYDLFGIRLTERQKEETLAVVLALTVMLGLFWFLLRGCSVGPIASVVGDTTGDVVGVEQIDESLDLTEDLALDTEVEGISADLNVETPDVDTNIDRSGAIAAGAGAAAVVGSGNVADSANVSEGAAVISEEAAVVSEEAAVVSEEAAVVSEEAAVVADDVEATDPTAEPEPTATPVPPTVTPTSPPPFEMPTIDAAASGFAAVAAGEAFMLKGTGMPGSEVGIVVDGEVTETITVPDSGAWEYELALPAGDHEIYLQGADAAGNLQGDTKANPIQFSLADPITAPTLALPDGELVADLNLDLNGTGTPGSSIAIFVDGEQVDTVTVGDDGNWSYSLVLPSGDHEVYATALDADGNVLADLQTEPIQFNVAAAALQPIIIGSTIADNTVSLTGLADPGAVVEILEDGVLIGEATADDIGDWSFIHVAETGQHTYEVRLPGGDPTPNSQVVIDVVEVEPTPEPEPTATPVPQPTATPAPAAAPADSSGITCTGEHGFRQGNKWIVDTCDTMSYVSEQTGVALGTLIQLNPQIPNPDIIYPGQILNLP